MWSSESNERLAICRERLHSSVILRSWELSSPTGMDLGGGWRGGTAPPPPHFWHDLQLSNTTGILQKKNCVVYWCRGKRWDKVEEFMINTAKMIVKMVVPRPPININVSVMYSMDSANPVAVNVNVTRKTYFYWTLFHGVPSVSMQGTEHPRSSFGPVFNL